MSSSSSTDRADARTSVGTQLAHAFALLDREVPQAYAEIGKRLGAVRVRLTVDGEIFDVANIEGKPAVIDSTEDASVAITTTQAVTRDVLAGRCTLAEVLRDDALRARGALRDLVAVLAALDAFIHGAVRCRAMSELFDEFQTERVA